MEGNLLWEIHRHYAVNVQDKVVLGGSDAGQEQTERIPWEGTSGTERSRQGGKRGLRKLVNQLRPERTDCWEPSLQR